MDSAGTRRVSFIEEDDGLASIADMEAGFSGSHRTFLSRTLHYSSMRNLSLPSSVASPRSGRFFNGGFEENKPHFLEACFLCNKPLGLNKDIFMYRGDTPFCSEECRQEQIEIDEANEKNRSLSASRKTMTKDQKKSKSSSPTKAQDYPFRTGTVAAA